MVLQIQANQWVKGWQGFPQLVGTPEPTADGTLWFVAEPVCQQTLAQLQDDPLLLLEVVQQVLLAQMRHTCFVLQNPGGAAIMSCMLLAWGSSAAACFCRLRCRLPLVLGLLAGWCACSMAAALCLIHSFPQMLWHLTGAHHHAGP